MFAVHSCVLDLPRLCLRCGQVEVPLTRIETRLLALLSAHVDEWVSEYTVRKIVWDESADTDPHIGCDKIEASVSRLRRKVKGNSLPLAIRSSRQHGLMITRATRGGGAD